MQSTAISQDPLAPWHEFILVTGTNTMELALTALLLLVDVRRSDIVVRNLYSMVQQYMNGESADLAGQWHQISQELHERIVNPVLTRK